MDNRLEEKVEKLVDSNHKQDIYIEKLSSSIASIKEILELLHKELQRNTENWMDHMARTAANEERILLVETMLTEWKEILKTLKTTTKKVDTMWAFFKGAAWAFGIIAATILLLSKIGLLTIS